MSHAELTGLSENSVMTVTEAVARRRSVRAFLTTPVSRAILERVLDKARFAPSGGNVQPWQAVVVAGEPLRELFAELGRLMAAGQTASDHPGAPHDHMEPWLARRRDCGAALYSTLGIARGDKAARDAQTAKNWIGFGAPCMLFCHTPALMQPPQWGDMGIWLQTAMLLLQEEGLGTCAQGAWAHVGQTLRAMLGIPEDHIVWCGLAIGYPDPAAPENDLRTNRAPLAETVQFIGCE